MLKLNKQLADKRAVWLYDMRLPEEDRKEILKEMARVMIQKGVKTNEKRRSIL